MPYKIGVKTVPAQAIAAVRRQAKLAELTRVVPDGCGQVWNFFRAAGVSGGRNIAVYLDDDINLEVGAEVHAPFAGDGNVFCSSTPAGVVATTIHIGPYNRLHQAHEAVRDWCAANGRHFAGPNWEVYGHWTNDPSQLRTDVYYLLAD
jgi:effector-binding domain-containing protein